MPKLEWQPTKTSWTWYCITNRRTLINIPAPRLKSLVPFQSNVKSKTECCRDEPKTNFCWSPICCVKRVLSRILALHPHDSQPKTSPSSADWLSGPVANLSHKTFEPNNVVLLQHKCPDSLSKWYEPADSSTLMLNLPKATVIPKILNSEIAEKCFIWLKSYTTRAAHLSYPSASLLEAAYSLTSNIIGHLRDSALSWGGVP